jgi:coenzyme F420-0:L-glutamate ligase/coenzyme F420-1:gamma-L-glutamate ligase
VTNAITIIGIPGIPEIRKGDDLAGAIFDAAHSSDIEFQHSDIVVVTQKVVSKAEGRVVEVTADDHDAKQAVVHSETARVIRSREGLVITETRHGFVCANAGVDFSNIEKGHATLLPIDPDLSARRLRTRLGRLTGRELFVVVSDTFGRAWRIGQTNVAIGVAGMLPTIDYKGAADHFGNELRVTNIATADELAGAAELVMGKSDGVPVAIVRGARVTPGRGSAAQLVRPASEDLFR